MLKSWLKLILISVLTISSFTGCNRSNDDNVPNVNVELTIHGLSDEKWTYFSFEKGETVGQSTFLSEEEDNAWAERSDWDFAICGDLIKTNGGESGNGQGGVLRDTENNFSSLELAPETGYITDQSAIVD